MRRMKKLGARERCEVETFIRDRETDNAETRRAQAILLLSDGAKENLIRSLTGFSRRHAFALKRKFMKKGIDGLRTKKRKLKSLLTKGQIKEIIKNIKTCTPKDFGINSDQWATSILGQLIKEQYGVEYKSRTSLYLIFKKAKFSYHKPGLQYKNRDQEKIDLWKENLKETLKPFDFKKNAILLVQDEMILTTQTTCQKIWLPQGEYPIVDVSTNRKRRCIYGFLNVVKGEEHAFKTMGANSEATKKVLNKIGKLYPKQKIVIIWDNASWHKSQEIRRYLSETKHDFHLINFPPYAPDENPQEHVWKAGRENATHNKFISDIDKATDEFVAYLNKTTFSYKFLNWN